MRTKLITIICAVTLCIATTSARAEVSTDPAMVVADVIVVRPLCFVATVVGSVFFVVSLPVAATSKSIKHTAHVLVVSPARATFTRPMGDLEDLMDY
jgi:hypothetical protein